MKQELDSGSALDLIRYRLQRAKEIIKEGWKSFDSNPLSFS